MIRPASIGLSEICRADWIGELACAGVKCLRFYEEELRNNRSLFACELSTLLQLTIVFLQSVVDKY